eukprot:TRINITY_DN47083_c0_g1_i1.p1 TRINITY_DN47083_c0_g1~~TRINITY_DN47083_c0_g1_i1.p1  ORF type:complete len:230 (-),score=21.66 TRINITY_DN47083_c0_g1_i1:42-731(-)
MTETVRKGDPYADYISYDPDADDYDPLTSILQPPVECTEEITRKQISALGRRIDRGGDPVVLDHYYRVLRDLQDIVDAEDSENEDGISGVDTCYVRTPSDAMGHKRTGSNGSDLSTTSTRCPEPADVSFGFEQVGTGARNGTQFVRASPATPAPTAHRLPLSVPQAFPGKPARATISRIVYRSPVQVIVTPSMTQPAPALAGRMGMGMQYTYARAIGYATPLICAGRCQ